MGFEYTTLSALCKFNFLKCLNGLLPSTFKSYFIFVDHMKRTKDLRSRNTFFLTRVNLKKIRKLPPYKFPNAWNENKHLFSEDNSTSTFLTNLINDHYEKKNRCFKKTQCFICKNLETIKSKTTSKKLKKMKRIKKTQGTTKVCTNK